jgi:hypothetical protein
VFAKVMRGAVWQLQQDSGASDLVLESPLAGDEIAAVADTWLGRLWQWMSRSGLQLGLRGGSAEVAYKGGGCDALRPQTGERAKRTHEKACGCRMQ